MSNQVYKNSTVKYPLLNSGMAVYKLSASESVPNNASTRVTTWLQEYSTLDNHVSNASGLFTINSDGVYCIQANCIFSANVTGARSQSILYIGTVYSARVANVEVLSAGAGDDTRLESSVIIQAYKGDQFEIDVFQNSGGALNIFGNPADPFSKVIITRLA